MIGLADRPLNRLLDDIAAATPAPGGGSSAAAVTAVGAALAEMAARFAMGAEGSGAAGLAERARELRERALELAEIELTTYAPVLEAARLDADDPNRPGRLAAALDDAACPPLEIAEVAAEAAELAARVAREGKESLSGDAATGALLAEAACRAAVTLAQLDLAAADRARGSDSDEDSVSRTTGVARDRRTRASALAARALAVRDGLLG